MPLEAQRQGAGEMNALLLGSVDEKPQLCYCDSQYFAAHHLSRVADGVAGDIVDRLAAGAGDVADSSAGAVYYWRRPAIGDVQTLGKRTSV